MGPLFFKTIFSLPGKVADKNGHPDLENNCSTYKIRPFK
jgi:hypothetical protein